MPLLVLLGLLLALPLFLALLFPIALFQRYRVGTSRQQARGWLLTLNVVGIALSAVMFLSGAVITNVWIPNAFAYSALGMAGGGLLGILGLLLTRWEPTPRALHYTPNRLLVLAITLVITARLAYGLWRAWQTWGGIANRADWVVEAGVAESMAAGAVVIGYYLVYWLGVRRRQTRHARRRLRTM